jgi:integrase/recombinase XerD
MKKIDYYEISKQKLKYLNYSDNTIKSYLFYINQFLKSTKISPTRLNSNDFQNYLNNYNFTSISQQNQIINSIKFFYNEILNKKYNKVSFKRPKTKKSLPKVIDNYFIKEKISKIQNLKHKTILTLTYSVGLRVSEVVNLKIDCIDSKRMLIYIKNSKGKKDRVVPLSKIVLELLRKYYKEYKPKEYLFNGQKSLRYSTGSCQKIYKKHIDKNSSFHTLRHSSFTNLYDPSKKTTTSLVS